ncbi:MAG: class I SAM-dependent methyltransferase [Gammaproteobacteria bacterium]
MISKKSGILAAGMMLLSASLLADAVYTTGKASRHGIGKFYMGREISQVMGHRGMRWLERKARQDEERTDLLLSMLPITPNMVVADIGAGSGYFSIPIAEQLTAGKVIAVDIQNEMLTVIKQKARQLGIKNIDTLKGSESNPNLPIQSVDLVLMVDAYHEFEFPVEMAAGIKDGLKPGGKVVLVEYREEDPSVPILRLHKMSAAQVIKEWQAAGFEFEKNLQELPQQHVLIFSKP